MTVEGDMVIREADRGDCRELAELRWLLQTGDRETAGPAFGEFARHFDGGPASWLAYRHFVAETGRAGWSVARASVTSKTCGAAGKGQRRLGIPWRIATFGPPGAIVGSALA